MIDKIKVSFSGGRTSFCMTDLLLKEYPDSEFLITFANTGLEHPATLDFVHAADQHWGGVVHWLEAEFHGEGIDVTPRRVDYEAASRNGEPFHDYIKKHGIPNAVAKGCTSRLKQTPIEKYAKARGFHLAPTAIGIRADEIDRMSQYAEKYRLWYPLAEWGYTKEMVNAYCGQFPFDLKIPSDGYGNCVGCFKKSDRKLYTVATENPELLQWWVDMGEQYATHHTTDKAGQFYKAVSPDGTRKFYRHHRTAKNIIDEANTLKFEPYQDSRQLTIWGALDMGGACDQGCEVYSDL